MHFLRRFNHQNTALSIICILLFVSANSIYAQSYFGLQIGVNSGKFSGDSPPNFKYSGKIQYNAGLLFDWQLKDDIFLSAAPSYLISGSKLQYPFEINEDEIEYGDSVDLKIQMFTLPVLVKILSDNQRWQFSGGFEFAFPTKLLADNSVEEIDLTNDINGIGLNMIFGLGYRIPIERSVLVINLGYSQGLTNLANNEDATDSLLPRIRFTSFRLTATWLLPVGKSKE
jgi:hypothetical protein